MTKKQDPLAICDRIVGEMDDAPWAWSYIGEKTNGYIIGKAWDQNGNDVAGHVSDDDLHERIGEAMGLIQHEAATCNYANARGIAFLKNVWPKVRDVLEKTTRPYRDGTGRGDFCPACQMLMKRHANDCALAAFELAVEEYSDEA